MSPDAATHALDAAKIRYRSDWGRGYFEVSRRPGKPALPEHTSAQVLVFEGGTSGSVQFDECDTMTEVSTFNTAMPAKAADARLADLERQFGPPLHVDAGAGADELRVWESPSTRMQFWLGHVPATGLARLTERYSPVAPTRHVWRTPCPPR